jgi:hypothetical protein
MAYTVTYTPTSSDDNIGGWVSFYSFYPEYMAGMNSDFFSFKNGNLNIHNTDTNGRATFYLEESIDGDSSILPYVTPRVKTCFNGTPITSKVFKAIRALAEVQASSNLDTSLQTDMNSGTTVTFVKKENAHFAYIKQVGYDDNVRFFKGVGTAPASVSYFVGTPTGETSVIGYTPENPISNTVIQYELGFPINITKIINRKDKVAIELFVDYSVPIPPTPPAPGDYISVAARGSENESAGITGHIMEIDLSLKIDLSLNTTSRAEVYAVEADYMESKP